MHQLDSSNNGQTVKMRVGDTLTITLPENATTGYSWSLARYNKALLEATGSEFHYPPNTVGASGQVVFSFKARKAGSGGITLKHWRPWEGDTSVIARFSVRVQVQVRQ